MEGGGISRSRPLLAAEQVASLDTGASPLAVILDCSARTIAYGQQCTQLRRLSARILCYLGSRRGQPVSASELAAALGLRSGVDVIAAARQGIGALRAELRALGLDGLIVSQRGAGYAVTGSVRLIVDDVADQQSTPACCRPQRSDVGLRARAGLRHPRASQDIPAMKPMVCSLGVIDLAARCFWLDGRRLLTRSERDFRLLARLVSEGGGAVEEHELMKLCGYRADRSGPELLRRASRHLNRRFGREGIPWRIKPTALALGSPYVLQRAHVAERGALTADMTADTCCSRTRQGRVTEYQ